MERHLLWTLPAPAAALDAWRQVTRRLVLVESVWGARAPWTERRRAGLRHQLRRWRGVAPDHHGEYSEALRSSLPFGQGTPPDAVIEVVRAAGFTDARVERLADVEAAERAALPFPERLLGTAPRFAVTAMAAATV
jgi:hypothetical protein